MTDADRESPNPERAARSQDDELDEFYNPRDAARDTGDSEEVVAEAWEAAREDAEDTSPPARNPRSDVDLLDVADTPFDALQNVDADDAGVPGNDPDISGQEDLEAIDVDTDVDIDEDVSTRDVGTHDVAP